MSRTRTIETDGYIAMRDQDPEIESGSEITEHGYKVTGYDQDGVEIIENVGDVASAHFWRSGREQGFSDVKKNGSWTRGVVPCVMTPRGIVPIKNKKLEEDTDYSGKNIAGKPEDIDPNFSDPIDDVVSVDGTTPEFGDIGLVVQVLNQKEEHLLFIPIQKKNELDNPLPVPAFCHGREQFIDEPVPESLKVITTLDIEEEESFIFTNLFRTKKLLVTDREEQALLSPLEIGEGSIICKSTQNLQGIPAQNCSAVLEDVFIYTPNLIPGLLRDAAGGDIRVWVVHSDGIGELEIQSDCCDEDDENGDTGEELPEVIKYSDGEGNVSFLGRESNNNFGPRYSTTVFSANNFPELVPQAVGSAVFVGLITNGNQGFNLDINIINSEGFSDPFSLDNQTEIIPFTNLFGSYQEINPGPFGNPRTLSATISRV